MNTSEFMGDSELVHFGCCCVLIQYNKGKSERSRKIKGFYELSLFFFHLLARCVAEMVMAGCNGMKLLYTAFRKRGYKNEV